METGDSGSVHQQEVWGVYINKSVGSVHQQEVGVGGGGQGCGRGGVGTYSKTPDTG
jgi:hypothetical protein